MDIFTIIINGFSTLENSMDILIFNHGILTYFLLCLVIFCQTAFIFMSFLPGDSILFATGALAATGSFEWYILIPLLIIAAFLGNICDYWIGYFLEERAFHEKKKGIFNINNLRKAHQFYEKFGGFTIVFSQFVVFIRAFAPFIAGIARMNFRKFLIFNLIGAILWVSAFVVMGMLLGEIPFLKDNLLLSITMLFVFSIIFLPVLAVIIKKIGKVQKT
jgi:membrane-associated protein